MVVLKSIAEVQKAQLQGSILTIGSFDGVHLGHRQLVARMLQYDARAPKVVMTFDPHPAKILSQQPPPLLFNKEDQIEQFSKLNVDFLFFLPFDKKQAQLGAVAFIDELIEPLFKPKAVVVGYDFSFGKDRQGQLTLLQKILVPKGTDVVALRPFYNGEDIVSSTLIRRLLSKGEIERVHVLLDRPYYLQGVVVEGRQLGRTLSFPTANLKCNNEIFPGTGVYYCQTKVDDKIFKAVGNVGFNPTVSTNHNLKIEFHLLDFNGDLYGKTLRFDFLKKLRDEKRFSSKEELRQQILKDVEKARTL